MSAFERLGRLHPALVHLPIAASFLLLPALLLWIARGGGWREACRLLAWSALGGGAFAGLSGLLWARSMEFLPAGGFVPLRPGLFSTHEALAACGLVPALLALLGVERRRPRSALAAALLTAALWGAAGHWGGRMAFPEPETLSSQIFPEVPWATSVSPRSS
ncbi:MAG TPA: hypothetical protein VJ600_03010 [Holophagaceae bacterium]|nr:hypothetical protein [Holophagaceae bacterium]